MKKISFLCVIFVLLAAVMSAAADSVWMPMDDYFIGTWDPASDNSCKSLERRAYMAAGENGYVTAVKTPVDRTPVKIYPNGTEFLIDFFCGIGDDLWGTVRSVRLPGERLFQEDFSAQSGYISQKELVRAFDSETFAELNSNSIYGFTDEFNPCQNRTPFVVWSYPDSGVQLTVVSDVTLEYNCHEFQYDSSFFPIVFDRIWTAEDGSRWAGVILKRMNLRGWVNLEHPTAGVYVGR